jgi:hypothetical protein
VPGTFEQLQPSARDQRGEAFGLADVGDPLVGPLDDERWLPDRSSHRHRRLEVDAACTDRRCQRLGVGIEPVPHGIVDLLRRMRFGERLPEEELEVAAVVASPEVDVLLVPPIVVRERLLEGRVAPRSPPEWRRRTDEDETDHAIGLLGSKDDHRPRRGG